MTPRITNKTVRRKLHPEAKAALMGESAAMWSGPKPTFPPPHCGCGHARDQHTDYDTDCTRCECDGYIP